MGWDGRASENNLLRPSVCPPPSCLESIALEPCSHNLNDRFGRKISSDLNFLPLKKSTISQLGSRPTSTTIACVSLFVYSSAPGWGIEKAEGASECGRRSEQRPWDFFGDCTIFVSRILRRAFPPICRKSASHRCLEMAQGDPAISTQDPVWSHCRSRGILR